MLSHPSSIVLPVQREAEEVFEEVREGTVAVAEETMGEQADWADMVADTGSRHLVGWAAGMMVVAVRMAEVPVVLVDLAVALV